MEKVEEVFSDAEIARLVSVAKFPASADTSVFARFLRDAAYFYAESSREQDVNEQHDVASEIHSAAEKRQYDQLALTLDRLPPIIRMTLKERALRRSMRVPTPGDLLDPELRDVACENLASLARFGMRMKEGRRRPGGHRSRSLEIILAAPAPSRHVPKRAAELVFIERLQVAWLCATGRAAPRTANRYVKGPFALLAEECFHLLGVPHADAVGLINEIERRRKACLSEKEACQVSNL